ncbi:hypothetical protein DMN91_008419 [Ooceraea biroi]|uniref:Uncharacterized protein n=1 Tax=Ooceraea biroi TaxID=2015173 RepID=A0A3L8DHD6_OOCBI|nr:hypothetical protein DMN91_008419 [Ooceraea biroi]
MFTIALCLMIQEITTICLISSVSFAIDFWFMLDSPYYLAMRGQLNKPMAMLKKLRGKTDVSEELKIIVWWV